MSKLNKPLDLLRPYGFNATLLNDLIEVTKYNPEQLFIANENKPIRVVSVSLLANSKQPKKLLKVLKQIGIYNMLCVNTRPDYYTFICKTYEGKLLTRESKKDMSYSRAFSLALLEFIKRIDVKKSSISDIRQVSTIDTEIDILDDYSIEEGY